MKSISITMTSFIDFVIATPGSKVSKVRQIRSQYEGGYQPIKAPYRDLKDAIVASIREGRPPKSLRALLAGADERIAPHWAEIIDGFKSFVGRRKLMLGPLPKAVTWASGGLSVSVNPELNVRVAGEPHLVKLYFKKDKLSKVRLNSMLYLLERSFPRAGTVGILEVRRGKLFTPPVPPYVAALLPGEAASFVEIWNQLGHGGATEQPAASS